MFKNQSDIKSTLRVEDSDLLAFLLDAEVQASIGERPTLPVSYSELSEQLLWDVLSDLESDHFEVEVVA